MEKFVFENSFGGPPQVGAWAGGYFEFGPPASVSYAPASA